MTMTDTPFDITNPEMRNAFELISKTNKSFFLTGRAGTGKTTFLQLVQSCVDKRFIVLAPTGVAAINAGGQTIHSFFGFDLGVQGPLSIGRMTSNNIEVANNIDTIIIDEVSMVRCDIIDAVDRMLRFYRRSSLPFGGVQMVFVGDLFQLSPIAKKEEQGILSEIYGTNSFFFFQARCLRNVTLAKIEFKKIYRQSDSHFINLLEHFRTGNVTSGDLMEINSRVITASDNTDKDEMRIILTAYRGDATAINTVRLDELKGDKFRYPALYEGNVEKLKDVVEDELLLKVGAQVMFLKNDSLGRWANGTIGTVVELDEFGVTVCLENGNKVGVEKDIWEAIEYEYRKDQKVCQKMVVGRVAQFPLRLAWAITIHKSQSLTFDKVDIDFGRGAFASGQAYVALSRARSLEGLRLLSPIGFNSIRVSREIMSFASTYNDEQVISQEIAVGQALRDLENAGSLDEIATLLYDMCIKEAHTGCVGYAYDLLNRALSYVVDDSCLFDREWILLPEDSTKHIILNAAGLLYSGQYDECIRLIAPIVSATPKYFNGLYLMVRALEFKEDWGTVESLYNQMIDMFRETTDNGLDSPSFRKMKYRVAILNEFHYGEKGVDIIADMIGEMPGYDKYHLALRRMKMKRKDAFSIDGMEDNDLISQMLDETISDEEFLNTMRTARDNRTELWEQYLLLVTRIS